LILFFRPRIAGIRAGWIGRDAVVEEGAGLVGEFPEDSGMGRFHKVSTNLVRNYLAPPGAWVSLLERRLQGSKFSPFSVFSDGHGRPKPQKTTVKTTGNVSESCLKFPGVAFSSDARPSYATRSTKTPPEQWEAFKLGAGAGFEPAAAKSQSVADQEGCASEAEGCAQLSSQIIDSYLHGLASVAIAWPKLKPELRSAILAIIASVEP
jgi:hypothetical protein